MYWENGKTFSSQGILNKLEKSGNFTQNIGKIRKFYSKYFFILFFLLSFYLKYTHKINLCIC